MSQETEGAVRTATPMPFPSLLEHLSSVTERIRRVEAAKKGVDDRSLVSPFSETHVFLLGEVDRLEESIREIREDLDLEMKSRVPMPFADLTLVVRARRGAGAGPEVPDEYWSVTRIMAAPHLRGGRPAEMGEGAEAFVVVSYAVADSRHATASRVRGVWFEGLGDGKFGVGLSDSLLVQGDTAVTERQEEGDRGEQLERAKIDLTMVAAISHPANYVVRVTPALSPREERRAAAGKPRPPAKSPHFIVVDHDVLVGMSGRSTGTHASPVPHERRGHWRRLSERCRHARMLGGERTWVGPAYVGERSFTDGKNAYEVLLDFRSRAAGGV